MWVSLRTIIKVVGCYIVGYGVKLIGYTDFVSGYNTCKTSYTDFGRNKIHGSRGWLSEKSVMLRSNLRGSTVVSV